MKILVLRFSSIGDIVLTTPVVRCLKTQLHAEVHYLTKASYASLLENNPHVDHVHTFEQHIQEILPRLIEAQFDHVVDLHKNIRSKQVCKALKKPASTFPKLNVLKFLTTFTKINWLPHIHIVDRYFEAVKQFQVSNDNLGLDYFIPADQHVSTKALLPEAFQAGYIAFAIGAQHEGKKMSVAGMKKLLEHIDYPVVLLGDQHDKVQAEELLNQYASPQIYNLCGKLSLDQSASVLDQAQVVFTHDSGLMHMASALKKTVFSFWGDTSPVFGMYPYLPGEDSQIFEPAVAGRPRSKLGKRKWWHFRGNLADKIDFDRVAQALSKLLK